jgi:hypothetical protein
MEVISCGQDAENTPSDVRSASSRVVPHRARSARISEYFRRDSLIQRNERGAAERRMLGGFWEAIMI